MAAAKPLEAAVLANIFCGAMRMGMQTTLVMIALGQAVILTPPLVSTVVPTAGPFVSLGRLADIVPPCEVTERLTSLRPFLEMICAECPNITRIVNALARTTNGWQALSERCRFQAGEPIVPMLAKASTGPEHILEELRPEGGAAGEASENTSSEAVESAPGANDKLSPLTCEYKYDGMRAQIHLTPEHGVRIFSRGMETTTPRFPDIVLFIGQALGDLRASFGKQRSRAEVDKLISSSFPRGSESVPWFGMWKGVKSFVMDAEVVAVERHVAPTESDDSDATPDAAGRASSDGGTTPIKPTILSFGSVMSRPQKGVKAEDIKTTVCVYAFDLLYLNGTSLLNNTLRVRRDLLRAHFPIYLGYFDHATGSDASDLESISTLFQEAVKGACEGLMVKLLDEGSWYQPAARSHKWLKVREDSYLGLTPFQRERILLTFSDVQLCSDSIVLSHVVCDIIRVAQERLSCIGRYAGPGSCGGQVWQRESGKVGGEYITSVLQP